ncbi:MAG TPA: DUF2269 family protein [Puia sp.]|jgi:uncharacterized membrane protein
MNLSFFLVLHIIGLSVMAGATAVDYFCFAHFWRQYPRDKARAAALLPVLANFRFLFAGAFILLLISGIGMVAWSHGAFAEQLWFRVKMGVLLLIIVNGAIIGGRATRNLRRAVEAELAGTREGQQSRTFKGRIRTVHLLQLVLFVVIFVLSVYKFN